MNKQTPMNWSEVVKEIYENENLHNYSEQNISDLDNQVELTCVTPTETSYNKS